MSASRFWDIFKNRYRKASGASTSVTLHSLYLAAKDAVTHQFKKAYSNSTIDMIMSNRQTVINPTEAGQFERVTAVGMTDTQIFKGDCITDANGDEWTIVEAWQIGLNTLTVMYMCRLELEMLRADVNYPIPDADLDTGGITMLVGVAEFDPLWILCTLTSMVQTAYDNQVNTLSISTTDRQSTPQNNSSLTCSLSTTLNTSVV